ncbi:hypothetical protein BGZ58_002662 [Dissophora ornata]|nr:hypothetical protein BGZ58_002662 [Dissophora ornata]
MSLELLTARCSGFCLSAETLLLPGRATSLWGATAVLWLPRHFHRYTRRKSAFFSGEDHLIGDSAYALTRTVIIAYKRKNQLADRDRFDKRLRASRVKIEYGFGWLKEKYPCLNSIRSDYALENDIRRFNQHILAYVVLYNILKIHRFEDNSDAGEEGEEDGETGYDAYEEDETETEEEDQGRHLYEYGEDDGDMNDEDGDGMHARAR